VKSELRTFPACQNQAGPDRPDEGVFDIPVCHAGHGTGRADPLEATDVAGRVPVDGA